MGLPGRMAHYVVMRSPIVIGSMSEPLSEEPPTEFRIFRAGENRINGKTYIFDDAAAAAVMAAYADRGADVMIDLQHDSLNEETARQRSDAHDAMGYAKLEIRNGELWAAGVTWGEEGANRLRKRTQRYPSPAFYAEDGRISEVINIGLVSSPGTHGMAPLVASHKERRSTSMLLVAALTLAATYIPSAKVRSRTPGVPLHGSRARQKDSRRGQSRRQ